MDENYDKPGKPSEKLIMRLEHLQRIFRMRMENLDHYRENENQKACITSLEAFNGILRLY